MSGTRKVIFGIIIALGAVAAVVFVRNVAGSRNSAPPLREATGTEWRVKCKCSECGHDFVGYVVGLQPGTKPRDGKRRYKKPGDSKWVPDSDQSGVDAVKALTCPKCGAEGSDVAPYSSETADGKAPMMH